MARRDGVQAGYLFLQLVIAYIVPGGMLSTLRHTPNKFTEAQNANRIKKAIIKQNSPIASDKAKPKIA